MKGLLICSLLSLASTLLQGQAHTRIESELLVDDSEILVKTDPAYTEEARVAGLEGRVLVSGIITADGAMPDPRVVQSLGLGLDDKAIEAVKQWQFEPPTVAAKPVAFLGIVAVDFRLKDKQSRWHLIGVRFPSAPAITRPVFADAKYPLGTGISVSAYDEGRIMSAIGRPPLR